MAVETSSADGFRGARLTGTDFAGATLRDCDVTGLKIVNSYLGNVRISGFLGNVVVNDVDVSAFVAAELDRRHPERVQLRAMGTVDEFRAMWDTIERLWADAVERAGRLSEPERQERVDDEWSFVETLRHLVFATDAWVSRTVLDQPMPYHRLGYPHSELPAADAAAIGLDLGARPSFDEVLGIRTGRMALVRGVLADLGSADLERRCTRAPTPDFPDERHTVRQCLATVMREECDHYRYAVRDLAVLEART